VKFYFKGIDAFAEHYEPYDKLHLNAPHPDLNLILANGSEKEWKWDSAIQATLGFGMKF